jgi:preprotein translocase subunit SecG
MNENDQARITGITHRYVRWMMILLPLLLLVVSVLTGLKKGEFETSISAYYGGPVRDILVGTLVGTAACLVAYQGVGLLEDYALNGAGFYAVFVALLPNNFAGIMANLRAKPTPDGMTAADYGSFLRIALPAVVLLCVVLFVHELGTGNLAQLFGAQAVGTASKVLTRFFVVLTAVLLAGFLALAMAQLWRGPADRITMEGISVGSWHATVHFLAAVFLIASLGVAVLTNTWPFFAFDSALWKSGRGYYLVIIVLMTVGLLVPWLVSKAVAPDHFVLLVEWWEIGLFAAFWSMETRRIDKASTLEKAKPGPLNEPQRVHEPAPDPAPAPAVLAGEG